MTEKTQKEDTTIWLSSLHKRLSFHEITGYETVCFPTIEEMWEVVREYVECGYSVQ